MRYSRYYELRSMATARCGTVVLGDAIDIEGKNGNQEG